MPENSAAAQGWVKGTDPKSGRVFYANHVTRKTQWDPPAGWHEEAIMAIHKEKELLEEPLASNWEVMHDPTTGKPFYVDHERKITTWERPKAAKQEPKQVKQQYNLKPAVASPPSSGNYNHLNHHSSAHAATSTRFQSNNTAYSQQESSAASSYYYPSSAPLPTHYTDIDLSDALPSLDFVVKHVADALRPTCSSCAAPFTLSKRRHHCRLCGDVFCDACCAHRLQLPLEGAEFEKPVRTCDLCRASASANNFFSLRRYLTPLLLRTTAAEEKQNDLDDDSVASAANVNAALSSFAQEFQQIMISNNPASAMDEKMTIPSTILVPELLKHMRDAETCDRAIQCVASLLALEQLASKHDWSAAVYEHSPQNNFFECTLTMLERNGSDRKTLYVQELAAKTIFYLTEPKTVAAVVQKLPDSNVVEGVDLVRAVRSLLDMSSVSKNPNLQRWSAAAIKNLVLEDQRRACMCVNDCAATIASGENLPESLAYASFMDELISTGGIMILCSLIGLDDADTRAHAVGALSATLSSTRAVDASLIALAEMTGGALGRTSSKDGDIVRAIVAGGGCGSSVSQLLLSADNSVAGMGCALLSSLVMPLLSDPQASLSLPSNYDYRNDQDGVGACREASIEIATASCLPALLSLARENGKNSRPIELRKVAMETLAAVAMSVGNMGKAWAQGTYEEGLERAGAPSKLKDAILLFNEEGVIDGAVEILQSSSGQSLGTGRETHASRIRESAGIILGQITFCSSEAILALQNRNVLSALLMTSNDASMMTPSTLRGDGAPRCLGVLETVSSILMFAWQHPSGASSELLDRLIELMDAGAVPYVSKVINSKIDWESKDKSVGAMKVRTAACRLLSCLFGVALTDETGIGARRLMDAVSSDARSYRGGERAPSDIVEATLGVLQTSSNYARRAVMGTLDQGVHYQAAVMDLVDSALLATGSMCGSSLAPGGSEGTMISSSHFLAAREDQFSVKRRAICKVACDIIVRVGKSGPALLPTMLVGAFGESTVLSSLRAALAIAQNGSTDEHAKLAISGVLVPVSDSLRVALANGDLYRFSASLAMVRFCGPHIAGGQRGGLESVRDAIRIATNVLTLPINPEATIEQMETQDALKAECISALESLSQNASLWSSISAEALPAIAQYLHSTAAMKSGNAKRQETRCAALKAVLQIVQVPSHAVAAAEAGLVDPLAKLLRTGDTKDDVPMLALEVLHAIAKYPHARQKAGFSNSGVARSICAAIGKSATEKPTQPSDTRADVTFLGFEMLHSILSDIDNDLETQVVLESKGAADFLDAVASEPMFVRAMCSTLLLTTNMRLTRHDADQSGESTFDISKAYGPPLIQVSEKCAGFEETHDASAAILYASCVFACAVDGRSSDSFWMTFLAQDIQGYDAEELSMLSATLCAHFLSLLTADYKAFTPLDPRRHNDFAAITRPLVRYRLLDTLKAAIHDMSEQPSYGEETSNPYLVSLIVSFNIPHVCLSLWKDPALLDLAFQLIKQIVEQEPDEVLHLFVQGKPAIMSLFDLLNLNSAFVATQNIGEIRSFLASVLGQLAENGLLAEAVKRYEVRGSAIAALAAACVSEEERTPDDDEDMTSHSLSTILMRCLVELCTVKDTLHSGKKKIELSPSEAEAIATNLGKKVCHMVLTRFLERAKLQQYEIEEDEGILEAPDVAMLCAVAQHDDALKILRSIGGLHALSLVAAEGELSAMQALKKACSGDVSVLLEGDTHIAIMALLNDEKSKTTVPRELESTAFELLARLCNESTFGREAVSEADDCKSCIARAIYVVAILTGEAESRELDENSDSDNSDEEPTARNENMDGIENGLPADDPPPDFSTVKELTKSPSDDLQKSSEETRLGFSACSFIASLVSTNIGRSELLDENGCIKSLSLLATSRDKCAEIQFAALLVLSRMARYATPDNGNLLIEDLADIFLSVFGSEISFSPTHDLNASKFYDTAIGGILVIFDYCSSKIQKAIADAAVKHFIKSVKSCSITRSTTRESERAYAAEFSYSLSSVLLLVRGKDFIDDIFTQEVLTSFVHLLLWRLDPKTSLGNTDKRSWDASISNCLTILSCLIWRPDVVLSEKKINLEALAGTTLMLARPGKAPRKAIDFKSALARLIDGPDSSAALAAHRILVRLF